MANPVEKKTTSLHKNDSTRGLPYQDRVHQALQFMRIHVNGLMKSWPPHSAPFNLNIYIITPITTVLKL